MRIYKQNKHLRCPYCGSGGLYTKKDMTRRCKKCGKSWRINNCGGRRK